MTNMEMLRSLTKDELAWFLMAYSDNCRCCVYKKTEEDGIFSPGTWDNCDRNDVNDTCIGGYRKWLDREPTKDDKWMFAVCKHNILIDKWNSMNAAIRDGFKLRYENGLAVEIVDDIGQDIEWLAKPFPF